MARTRTVHRLVVAGITAALVLVPAGSALACGGLIAPNGTISLTRTTTLAAYHDGVEHYITSFQFAGKVDGSLGSITPAARRPDEGDQGRRLDPAAARARGEPAGSSHATALFAAADSAAAGAAVVILKPKVDALDITVLKGGAVAVGNWAREHGFFLPPDAPAVLDFYAQRSPIFMATRFNAKRAAKQGLVQGEGTPVHVVIPTPNPWVPLRILTLGRQPPGPVQADVFLLTDRDPAMLPQAVSPNGDPNQQGHRPRAERVGVGEPDARPPLRPALELDPGRADVALVPEDRRRLRATLTNDLAIDASGYGHPDPVAAGFSLPTVPVPDGPTARTILWLGAWRSRSLRCSPGAGSTHAAVRSR